MKKKPGTVLMIFLAGIIAAPFLAEEAGLRINITESAPLGIWKIEDGFEIERGSLVSICPPDVPVTRAMAQTRALYAGNCKGSGMFPLLKPIAALPGDNVIVNRNGVSVNGEPVPNSSVTGKPMLKEGVYKVAPGEVWLFSTYAPNSFDSRYFGPVPISNIKGSARPIVVFGDLRNMKRGMIDD